MVKNDFLLRFLLFFGFFWAFKLVLEFFSIAWFRGQVNWLAIIGALLLALPAYKKAYKAISFSIVDRARLTTSIKWFLYVLACYGFYISIIKFIEFVFFNQRGFWFSFGYDTWSQIKAYSIMGFALIGAIFLTRMLVNQIGFMVPNVALGEINVSQKPEIEATKKQLASREANDKQTLHGSSKWSKVEEFSDLFNDFSNEQLRSKFEEYGGYVISPKELKYIKHSHAITIAGAGQGKGTTSIIPNLLTKPKDNWIILDVKGENAAVTARFQQQARQNVFILDPFDVQKSIGATHGIAKSGYNPLVVGRHLPEEEISDFATMLAEMFVPETKESASSDSFFADSARNLIKTYILYLITEPNLEERDLGKLYEMLRLAPEDEVRLWVNMGRNSHTKFGANEVKSIATTALQTWGGILSNARRSTAFLDSPLIRKSLQVADFDPMMLQTNNTTVYVILPERNLNTHKTWLRIVFGTILKLCNFTAKRRVNFLMDEFPILGRMDDFLRAFAFGRGQKISCWIFAQSLSQLKDVYGEDGLNTFLSNARLRMFFGVNDYYTQEYVSNLLGFSTEATFIQNQGRNSGTSTGESKSAGVMNYYGGTESSGTSTGLNMGATEQYTQRKLMQPDEVGNLSDKFILLVDGRKYLIDKKPYYSGGLYRDRYDPNPYVNS